MHLKDEQTNKQTNENKLRTYLIDGQFFWIPLWYAFNAEIDNSHSNVGTFQCDYTACWAAHIAGTNAAYFGNDHFPQMMIEADPVWFVFSTPKNSEKCGSSFDSLRCVDLSLCLVGFCTPLDFTFHWNYLDVHRQQWKCTQRKRKKRKEQTLIINHRRIDVNF